MKFRIITLIAALVAMFAAMSCGGGADNANAPANTAVKSNTMANAVVNTNAANIVVNAVGNTATFSNNTNAVNLKVGNSQSKTTANANSKVPKDANYICRDGTYSSGTQDSTACSGHDGVLKPLIHTPPEAGVKNPK